MTDWTPKPGEMVAVKARMDKISPRIAWVREIEDVEVGEVLPWRSAAELEALENVFTEAMAINILLDTGMDREDIDFTALATAIEDVEDARRSDDG